ncbi:hypothetical protein ACLOJK_013518, partial [Asimina triloba]
YTIYGSRRSMKQYGAPSSSSPFSTVNPSHPPPCVRRTGDAASRCTPKRPVVPSGEVHATDAPPIEPPASIDPIFLASGGPMLQPSIRRLLPQPITLSKAIRHAQIQRHPTTPPDHRPFHPTMASIRFLQQLTTHPCPIHAIRRCPVAAPSPPPIFPIRPHSAITVSLASSSRPSRGPATIQLSDLTPLPCRPASPMMPRTHRSPLPSSSRWRSDRAPSARRSIQQQPHLKGKSGQHPTSTHHAPSRPRPSRGLNDDRRPHLKISTIRETEAGKHLGGAE